jgi:GrpB-like predicted nucleotidyltransferase (UPF0157 family)
VSVLWFHSVAAMAITIVEYQPRWPDQFRAIGASLRDALGTTAHRIDHIGSTSVPGLAAKDIIDIQVTTDALDDPIIGPTMSALGYDWHDDLTSDHAPPGTSPPPYQLAKRVASRRAVTPHVNVHVRVDGAFNQRYALICRDYLRAHPSTAAAYGEIKRQLARHFPDDIAAYYDIKDPALDLFMSAAPEWVEHTGWKPGPSDA